MIRFPCPRCGATISAADDYANRKGKCPRCREVTTIPSAGVQASPPARKRRPTADEQAHAEPEEALAAEEDLPRRRRRDDDAEVDDRPRRHRRRDEYEDDDARPRRRIRRRGPYADCPNCGCPGFATKSSYTWWGGFVGPMIISCVRCQECGTRYNGTHGDYSTTRILIYHLVAAGIAVGFCLISIALGALSK
jgi:hypothetical protein